jgi:Ras GTPase-activating-like protein IQGAP2/3
MALSKKDLQINITLNELYNTHSLLAQHVDTLVSLAPSELFI